MKNNELFQTIEQLKNTLSDVSSAREQVAETVRAYSQTQGEIHSYVSNLEQIEKSIVSLITLLQTNKVVINQQSTDAVNNLKTSCDTVISHAKNEFSSTAQSFAENTARNVASMSTQINRFDKTIEKANCLTSKVENISSETQQLISTVSMLEQDLSESQKAQDIVLDQIKKNQENTISSLSVQDSVLSQQISHIDAIATSITNCHADLTNGIAQISSTLADLQNSIQKVSADLQNVIETKYACIEKNININRWLLVVGIILLAALNMILIYN